MNLAEVSDDPAFAAQGADTAVTHPDGTAHCWLWWSEGIPTLPKERLGIIGHYQAESAAAGQAVLEAACAHLTTQGCTLAVGPMDGNTWRRYRLVTGGDPAEPPFFLEPTNPPDYPAHWQNAGFESLAEYRSALATDLNWTDDRLPRIQKRVESAGLTLRPLATQGDALEADLRAIYKLTLVSFVHNYLYTPLEEEAFLGQYRPLAPLLRPELTVLAHDATGNLVGYLFALPDTNEAKRGEPIRTMIIKTLAVAPGRTWAGLGSLLTDHCLKAARESGYTRCIHALMHDSNASRNLSASYAGHSIRQYTLYSRRLTRG